MQFLNWYQGVNTKHIQRNKTYKFFDIIIFGIKILNRKPNKKNNHTKHTSM